MGLYRDPREFASDQAGAHSRNIRLMGGRRAPVRSHVSFRWRRGEWGYGAGGGRGGGGGGGEDTIVDVSAVEDGGCVDVELGRAVADRTLEAARSALRMAPLSTTRSASSVPPWSAPSSTRSAPSPWRLWESVHNEMVKLRENASFRIRRATVDEEGGGSAVLDMVRHDNEVNKLSRIAGIYNDDDFDFALVLSSRDVYTYWADHLDFRQEIFGEDGKLLFGDDGDLEEGDGNVSVSGSGSANCADEPPLRRGGEEPPSKRHGKVAAFSAEKDRPYGHSEDKENYLGVSIDSNDRGVGPICVDDFMGRASGSANPIVLGDSKKGPRYRNQTSPAAYGVSFTPPRTGGTSTPRTPKTAPPASRRQSELDSPEENHIVAGQASVDDSGRHTIRPGRRSIFEQAVDTLTPPRSGRKSGIFGQSQRKSKSFKHTPSMSRARAPLSMQKNMFDGIDPLSPDESTLSANEDDPCPGPLSSANHRRWGMSHGHGMTSSKRNLMTPPVKSIEKDNALRCRTNTIERSGNKLFDKEETEKNDREHDDAYKAGKRLDGSDGANIDAEDIPSQTVPRGIAARTTGMDEFLSVLKRGIVVRRHKPSTESAFVKLFSLDGGDTIEYSYVAPDEAMIALKEQAVRFNQNGRTGAGDTSGMNRWRWHQDEEARTRKQESKKKEKNMPDFIAAERYAAERYRQIVKTKGNVGRVITDLATRARHGGEVKTADIVAVHPSIHPDTFNEDEKGTVSIRTSPSDYVESLSFSLVLPGSFDRLRHKSGTKAMQQRWYAGEGSPQSFHYLDIESATEGEYWMIFRGFLLLHRDASSGRFAAQRAKGIGSNYTRHEIDQMEERRNSVEDGRGNNAMEGFLTEYTEPSKKTFFDKLSKTLHFGPANTLEYQPVNAPPPPSDYFLGFSSEGTQIWSRLRQAGLETQRIYALDTRKVMIKIRCPAERLTDVAEVLRLKLKTRDGTYAPFREKMISHFVPTDELASKKSLNGSTGATLFRSSDRQTIIDFIIRSRIRDSGAELGPRTDLGKAVASRVPLHMHARLEPLYETWVLFWKEENWDGRDGRSMRVGPQVCEIKYSGSSGSSSSSDSENHFSFEESNHIPSYWKRLLKGCLSQPLDSIEEYYGEKVAFYFAWIQHVSSYLIFLSVVGWVVFIVEQMGDVHWIKPVFSGVIMLWSFVVMVTWRQRSNFLAHRWGTLNYEEQEITRPHFTGKYEFDEVTQEWTVVYAPWKRWIKYSISVPLTFVFTTVSLLGILLVYRNRDNALARLYNDDTDEPFSFDFNPMVLFNSKPINAVQLSTEHLQKKGFWFNMVFYPCVLGLTLPLLNFILMRISYILNEFENYRTETEFRNHLIVKVFAFRFVCYFAAMYYYSGVAAAGTTEEHARNGMFRVATSLFIYVTIAHWWTIFLQVYFPMLIYRWRVYRERLTLRDVTREVEAMEADFKEVGRQLSQTERRHRQKRLINSRLLLEQSQSNIWEEMMLPMHDSFPEYIVAVVQFAYVTCFSVAFPITPFIVLLNHLLAMRLDAFKLCRGRRRPMAQKTGGIGVWEHVLHVVTVIAVFTNCTMMALVHFKGLAIDPLVLFAIAVGWEHVMLLIKYVMQATISPFPKSVREETRKEKFQASRQRNTNLRARKERRSEGIRPGENEPVRDRLRATPSKSVLDTVHETSPLVEDTTSSSEDSPLLQRSFEGSPIPAYNHSKKERDDSKLRRRNHSSARAKVKEAMHPANESKFMSKNSPLRCAKTKNKTDTSQEWNSPDKSPPSEPSTASVNATRDGEESILSMFQPQHRDAIPSAPPLTPDEDNFTITDICDDDADVSTLLSPLYEPSPSSAGAGRGSSVWQRQTERERATVEANLAAEERIRARLSNALGEVAPTANGANTSTRRRRRRDR